MPVAQHFLLIVLNGIEIKIRIQSCFLQTLLIVLNGIEICDNKQQHQTHEHF